MAGCIDNADRPGYRLCHEDEGGALATVTEDPPLPAVDSQIDLDGALVTVLYCRPTASGVDLVVTRPDGSIGRAVLTHEQLGRAAVPAHDGLGHPGRALATLWGRWMQHALPRIRSAVLATRPLQPFAHQDEAVFTHMISQPRLRFMLADEPGTGKTIMTGMYLAEGTRRGLVPGRTIIVVPAHLIEKWRRDLWRHFAVEARRLTAEIARDPADFDPRYDVWVVSIDLFTYNNDVRRRVAGPQASWSLAVFDEAHRLTPSSQMWGAGRELSVRAHHLLLLTATPHRGKEHFFRALMNLLDPQLYPWDRQSSADLPPLRPGSLSFLRRMKEDLRDRDGELLFPPRFAETIRVNLTPTEQAAYSAVMDYVDIFYDRNAVLARSIYGKRAASGIPAALATVTRREAALRGPAELRTGDPSSDLLSARSTADIDDESTWDRAEEEVVTARSRDKRAELDRLAGVIDTLRRASSSQPAKWLAMTHLLARHEISPGVGQLLVFSEFRDTAVWLSGLFLEAGYTVRVLEGAVDHRDRDHLQQEFLASKFQVLVSTDAGGEGIDLQSANVMVNYDIPWSLVRLEQRMGRLHRIGQRKPVFIYHLISPETREGRVQEVILNNILAASQALGGRVFDLMDATAERMGFDYTDAILSTYSDAREPPTVPGADALLATAQQLVTEETRLRTRTDRKAAEERFRADRLEAINPVIVDGFVEAMGRACGWRLSPGPLPGLRIARGSALPAALGGGTSVVVATDGAAVRQARADGVEGLDTIVVLGPTEPPFAELVGMAAELGAVDLIRGCRLIDSASLTGYWLLLYEASVELADEIGKRQRRPTPLLVRYSGSGAFVVEWESVLKLSAPMEGVPAAPPPPAARVEALRAAQAGLESTVDRERTERQRWVGQARKQLDDLGYRIEDELVELPIDQRRARLEEFEGIRQARLRTLNDLSQVSASSLQLVGWTQVHAGARRDSLGYDPDSEGLAVATVLGELERLGYVVDDRQTAGVGYDLFAKHPTTGDQRLVEVKGLTGGLGPVWLEQNEWVQAQQRGQDYWLYVVTACATTPRVEVRVRDPAGFVGNRVRRIERLQIRAADLRRMAEQNGNIA